MKKISAFLALSVIAVSICVTGCSVKSADSLLAKMTESEPESFTADIVGSFGGSAKIGGEKNETYYDIDFETAVEGAGAKEMNVELSGIVGMYQMEDDLDYSDYSRIEDVYLCFDGDEITRYYNGYDSWYSEVIDADDIGFDEKNMLKIRDDFCELMKNATVLSSTQDIDGVECYVLEYRPEGTEMSRFMKETCKKLDADDLWDDVCDYIDDAGTDVDSVIEGLGIQIDLYVSAEEGYFVALDIAADEFDYDTFMEAVGLYGDDLEDFFGDKVKKFEIGECFLSITLTDINDTSVSVPRKALEAEERSAGFEEYGTSSTYTGVSEEDEYASNDVLTLYDAYGGYVCDITVPQGMQYYEIYSCETSLDLMSSDWSVDIYVESDTSMLDEGMCAYLTGDDYDGSYEYETTDLDITFMGEEAFMVEERNTYLSDVNYYIVAPYTNSIGEDDFIILDFSYIIGADSWDTEDFISYAALIWSECK